MFSASHTFLSFQPSLLASCMKLREYNVMKYVVTIIILTLNMTMIQVIRVYHLSSLFIV